MVQCWIERDVRHQKEVTELHRVLVKISVTISLGHQYVGYQRERNRREQSTVMNVTLTTQVAAHYLVCDAWAMILPDVFEEEQ